VTCSLSAIAETIVFKNGDKLSGQIIEQNTTNLTFQAPAFGSVNLDRNAIAEILADTPPAEQSPPPQKTGVTATGGKWSGDTSISITFRESSNLDENGQITDVYKWEYYNLGASLRWKSGKNLFDWSSRYRYTQRNEDVHDDFFNLTQQYTYNFSPTYFARIKTLYQEDYRRKIKREQLQTAELGVNWINTEKLKLATSAGAAYHSYTRTDRSIAAGTNGPFSFSGGKFSFDQSFRWQANGTVALFEQFTHLGDLTAYHRFFKGGIESKLVKNLILQLAYSIERETDIAYDDRAYYDTKMLTSLRYKF
jgi:hypothetical protein